MTKKTDTPDTDPETVWILNREARLLQLSRFAPPDVAPGTIETIGLVRGPDGVAVPGVILAREHGLNEKLRVEVVVDLMPGLNASPYAAAKAVALVDAAEGMSPLGDGLERVDPRALDTFIAVTFASQSVCRRSLAEWLAIETRPKVRDAITERLARVRTASDAKLARGVTA